MSDHAAVPLDKVDPALAWQPWEPSPAEPWDLRRAGHLYRRAAFGATLAELRHAVRAGLPATLDLLSDGDPQGERYQEALANAGTRAARKNNPFELRGWWVQCMLGSPRPLREKMTLFWHNHFATSIAKVGRTGLMFQQNQLFRRHALGKFGPLLLEVSRDPAMLIWLDSNSNVRGKPNENYAREVMELFSLGVGHYTEKDVREAARAFTGWHVDGDAFAFRADLHDDGEKVVLGRKGNWNGDDVVRIVLEQPAAARFLVGKLYAYFVSETEPPAALLEPLADFFRKSDYDVGALVRVILRSRHFFSPHAYRRRIKSPAEFLVGAVRALTAGPVQSAVLVTRLDAMGQQLFAPPNVKGWVGGRAWLNSATLLARHNFAELVASGGVRGSDVESRLLSATSPLEARHLEVEEQVRQAAARAREARLGKTGPTTDPAELVRREGTRSPEAVADLLCELLLQGDVSPAARDRLVAHLRSCDADGEWNRGVREAAHAVLAMPEYQLA